MVVGAVLLVLAAVLLHQTHQEAAQAGAASQVLLERVQSAMAAQKDAVEYETEIIGETAASPETAEAPETPDDLPETGAAAAALPEDYDCIGYLELPKLERTLPVLDQWDYDRLKLAPCRQYGSVETGDLVIAAHNYVQHFGSLGMMAVGDAVRFTDLTGTVHSYVVSATAQVAPEETEVVLDSGYPLTLYTCTLGNQSRVVVYCDYAEE